MMGEKLIVSVLLVLGTKGTAGELLVHAAKPVLLFDSNAWQPYQHAQTQILWSQLCFQKATLCNPHDGIGVMMK